MFTCVDAHISIVNCDAAKTSQEFTSLLLPLSSLGTPGVCTHLILNKNFCYLPLPFTLLDTGYRLDDQPVGTR